MDDHFAKPQSNGVALVKKWTPPWNTNSNSIWTSRDLSHEPLARVIAQALPVLDVKFTFTFKTLSMYTALLRRNNMKQNRLENLSEKTKFRKRGRQMSKCFKPYVLCEIVRAVIRWYFRRPGAPHELNYEFTSETWFPAHTSSRLFSGRNDTKNNKTRARTRGIWGRK